MDILGKAAGRVGKAIGQAAATAADWYRLESEQRRLASLRAQALQTRAQIGEEMYTLWRARSLPPSSLDDLFVAIDRTMLAIEAQRRLVDDLRAQFEGTGSAPPAAPLTILEGDHFEVVDRAPPPPAPAAPTRILPGAGPEYAGTTVDVRGDFCPVCGRPHPGNKPFCGYCGARLA